MVSANPGIRSPLRPIASTGGVRVQFTNPLTGELVSRVLVPVCTACSDVMVTGARLDYLGRCACCVRDAKESA